MEPWASGAGWPRPPGVRLPRCLPLIPNRASSSSVIHQSPEARRAGALCPCVTCRGHSSRSCVQFTVCKDWPYFWALERKREPAWGRRPKASPMSLLSMQLGSLSSEQSPSHSLCHPQTPPSPPNRRTLRLAPPVKGVTYHVAPGGEELPYPLHNLS